MSNEAYCVNCRFCDEYSERNFFCELFETVVGGRNYCHCFECYPEISVL